MAYDHFKNGFSYTCLQCGRQVAYIRARSNCPRCQYTLFKVSRRGTGYPNTFTPREEHDKNPYVPDPIMTPGDERAQGGMGTRARGRTFPSDTSASDDLEKQRERDIPVSRHMFVDGAPLGEGVNDGTFYDPDSPLSNDNIIREQLFSKRPQVVGPHNMQKYRGVFDRVRRDQKGA